VPVATIARRAPAGTTRSEPGLVEAKAEPPQYNPCSQQEPWRGRSWPCPAMGVWASGVSACSLRRHQGLSLCSKALTFCPCTDLVEATRRVEIQLGEGNHRPPRFCHWVSMAQSRSATAPKPASPCDAAKLLKQRRPSLIDSARRALRSIDWVRPEMAQTTQTLQRNRAVSRTQRRHYRRRKPAIQRPALPFGDVRGEVAARSSPEQCRDRHRSSRPATGMKVGDQNLSGSSR